MPVRWRPVGMRIRPADRHRGPADGLCGRSWASRPTPTIAMPTLVPTPAATPSPTRPGPTPTIAMPTLVPTPAATPSPTRPVPPALQQLRVAKGMQPRPTCGPEWLDDKAQCPDTRTAVTRPGEWPSGACQECPDAHGGAARHRVGRGVAGRMSGPRRPVGGSLDRRDPGRCADRRDRPPRTPAQRHASGGAAWSREDKLAFARDRANLRPVGARHQPGQGGPRAEAWKPAPANRLVPLRGGLGGGEGRVRAFRSPGRTGGPGNHAGHLRDRRADPHLRPLGAGSQLR